MHRIVIVGGGFGGVAAAKAIKKNGLCNVHITLISEKPWLEYYGVLYRLIRGESADKVCLPLWMILGCCIQRCTDVITHIDPKTQTVRGTKGMYHYDTLILAPGSVPAYFNIPGMEEHAFTMRGAMDGMDIHERVIAQIATMAKAKSKKQSKQGRFVVIGGGPTGIEVAGEVLPLAQQTAYKYDIDPTHISVDLLEASEHIFPIAGQKASLRIQKRLEHLGVNVHLRTTVQAATSAGVILADGTRLEAATIIWTAGVAAHPLLRTIADVTLDKRGRIVVDELLRIPSHHNIFVLGDAASTPYSGMAQTAVYDGLFVARVLTAQHKRTRLPIYAPQAPAYAIPAGHRWSAVKLGSLHCYGIIGSVLRRAADLHVYMLLLPWRYVPAAFLGRLGGHYHSSSPSDRHVS